MSSQWQENNSQDGRLMICNPGELRPFVWATRILRHRFTALPK